MLDVYSQAIKYGDLVFVSGQLPINQDVVSWDETAILRRDQQVMKNLEAILTEARLTFDNIVMTTVYLNRP